MKNKIIKGLLGIVMLASGCAPSILKSYEKDVPESRKSYYRGTETLDANGDGRPDSEIKYYDRNQDDISDIEEIYFTNRSSKYPIFVSADTDLDGAFDTYYADEDLDGKPDIKHQDFEKANSHFSKLLQEYREYLNQSK